MKTLTLMFALFLSLTSFASDFMRSDSEALSFSKSDYSFIVSWVDGPKKGASKFIMKTWKNDVGTMNGPYQDLNQNLHIFLWMPTMGHGSAPVKITKLSDGEYEVSNVQFIMGGKWEIKFQLKEGAVVSDEAVVTLKI